MLKGGAMKLYPQNALLAAGGNYTRGQQPWNAHVVVDRELITGQNPASAREVGKLLLARLPK
jgi:putative intracellular protease/amidase